MNRDIPEPWSTRLVEKGLCDPRRSGTPSLGALARHVGVTTSTISQVIAGRRAPSASTVALLVDALGPDVRAWLSAPGEVSNWQPPAEVALLTRRQLRAIDELIRATAAANASDGPM